MDVFEAIHTRRSIRKYTTEDVSEAQVRQILEAAMMAPSAGNGQPWQFVVIRDREKLARIKDFNPYAAMAAHAPLGLLVCGDLSLEKYKGKGFWVQDCSAAVQNILLAAHALELGAVWTGIYPLEDRIAGVSQMFDLPEQVLPLALIVIGHSEAHLASKSRFKEERVHFEKW